MYFMLDKRPTFIAEFPLEADNDIDAVTEVMHELGSLPPSFMAKLYNIEVYYTEDSASHYFDNRNDCRLVCQFVFKEM